MGRRRVRELQLQLAEMRESRDKWKQLARKYVPENLIFAEFFAMFCEELEEETKK